MVEYRIYGVEKRIDNILLNSKKLNCKYWLNNHEGYEFPYRIAKEVWELEPENNDITHICCLQDDVELCDNFKEVCEMAIKAHPDAILSLSCMDTAIDIKNQKTPYYYSFSAHISGCSLICPIKYIKEIFKWAEERYGKNNLLAGHPHEDNMFQYWAWTFNKQIITLAPSPVQHIGDISLLFPEANGKYVQRSLYYENPCIADFSNTAVDYAPNPNNY